MEKSARQARERPPPQTPDESCDTYTERLRPRWTAEKAREAEDDALHGAARCEPPGTAFHGGIACNGRFLRARGVHLC